jgi:hypothetical protein
MIDTTKLSQEQQWGLAFAAQQANAAIEQANSGKPESEQQALFTPESYAEFVFRGACDSYYAQLIDFKKASALALFNAMSPEEQAALVDQLGIPPVLK